MVTIALLVSWIVAVLFTPYLGYKLLPDYANLDPRKSLSQRLVLSPLRRVFPRLIPPPPSRERVHEATMSTSAASIGAFAR